MRNKPFLPAAALLGIAVLIAAPNPARSSSTGKTRLAQDAQPQGSAKPGPEMAQLQFRLGDWNVVSTYPKSALFPDGGEEHGTYSCHPGPGGFSIVADFQAEGLEGSIQGLQITTWDPKENAYLDYTFGNEFPGAYEQQGHWDGDNLVMGGQFDMSGTAITFRQSVHADGPDNITLQEWFSQDGAPMQLMETTKATRK